MVGYELIGKIVGTAVIAALLVMTGVHYGTQAEHARRVAEVDTLKNAYQARIDEAARAKDAAEAFALAKEQAGQTALAIAATTHQKELTNERTKTAEAVARARAGDDRLRYYVDATANAGSGGAGTGVAAAARGSDGRATAELPAALAGDLLSLAGDADEVVLELQLAQDTIKAYLKVCGPVAKAPVEGGPSAAVMVHPQNPPPPLAGGLPSVRERPSDA